MPVAVDPVAVERVAVEPLAVVDALTPPDSCHDR